MSDNQPQLDPHQDLVAYLCAEFGIDERLPIYAGGLGVLAGDHLKTASDLGIPLIAVGLLYRNGYFRQQLDAHGHQHAGADVIDAEAVGLRLVSDVRGAPLEVDVPLAEHSLILRVWRYDVGRVPLFLLDADHPDNRPEHRAITERLYGGGPDNRLLQEVVLGIGAVRALMRLGLQPTVWHMNEGHAAFSSLERVRRRVAQGSSFEAALELVAARTVFTTHTPVPAGHDVFNHGQVHHWLGDYFGSLQSTERRLLGLGADAHGGHRFNMTALALRTSRFHNGVSRIHGDVASSAEGAMWPHTPPHLNPIGYVTNAVHLPTFLAPEWQAPLAKAVPDWRERPLTEADMRWLADMPGADFDATRRCLKRRLLATLRERLHAQHARNGLDAADAALAVRQLDADNDGILVLGFARRFATYKRATLLLSDIARLTRLLGREDRPTLLVFAGKAHPHDGGGQQLIRELYQQSLQPELIGRLIVVEGYDIGLARALVHGCDVWINTPEFPMEASGTSGMKSAVNGGVNASILDGWWAEGCDGTNGFGLEPDPAHDPDARNRAEAAALLDVLETGVQERYYADPDAWRTFSRRAMLTLIPQFGSARMLTDYVRKFYAPAAAHGRLLDERNSRTAIAFKRWKKIVHAQADNLRIELVSRHPLEVRVHLDGLHQEDLAVEADVGGQIVQLDLCALDRDTARYRAPVMSGSGVVRIRPVHAAMAHPYELGCLKVLELGG